MRAPAVVAGCLLVSACLYGIEYPRAVIAPVVGHWETIPDDGEVAAVADGTKVGRDVRPGPSCARAHALHDPA
jgi:hypothetical protein